MALHNYAADYLPVGLSTLAAAIYSGMSCNRLVGRWPSYEVWPPQ